MANLQQLTQRSEVGVIKPWGKATAPDGYVLCDGASLARAGTYADLFAVIGTSYGSADGSSFNVPNLQGKKEQGYDGSTYNLAGTGGANTVTVAVTNNQAVNSSLTNNQAVTVTGTIDNTSITVAQAPAHYHEIGRGNQASNQGPAAGVNNWGNTTTPQHGYSISEGSGTGHNHSHTLSGTMTGSVAITNALTGAITASGTNSFSPYVVVNYIIRY